MFFNNDFSENGNTIAGNSAYLQNAVKNDNSLRTIKVVAENTPPYSYIQNDSIMGFDVEVTRIIFEKLKIKPVYEIYLWAKCIEQVKSGNADAILSVFITPEREKFLTYPDEHMIYEDNAFFTLSETKLNYSGNLNDLKGSRIGVKYSTSYGYEFDHADFLTKDYSKNQETLIQKILEKRLEIGIGSVPVISYITRQMKCFDKVNFLKPYVTIDPLYVAFSKKKGNELLAQNFSRELKGFKKTLSYSYLLKKYGIINKNPDE
jgi:ABC-type amino acid transport/signal transduction systems, periplasmic component/domain